MAITRSQQAKQLLALGGRIGLQEGGIMPRLNQLGSGVSSAEQTLQEINQRLESAESSLGEGGGNQMPSGFGANRPVPEFMQSKPQNLEPLQQANPNSPLLGVFQSRPENTTGLTAAIPPGTTPNLEELYPNIGAQQINLEPMPRGGYRFGAFENRNIVGIPAAGYGAMSGSRSPLQTALGFADGGRVGYMAGMLVRGGKIGYQALRKYGIEGRDISRLFASLGTDKSLVGKEKTEYFKQLHKVLRNPDAFPDEIMDIQKQLGLDVGLGFKSGGLAKILEV